MIKNKNLLQNTDFFIRPQQYLQPLLISLECLPEALVPNWK